MPSKTGAEVREEFCSIHQKESERTNCDQPNSPAHPKTQKWTKHLRSPHLSQDNKVMAVAVSRDLTVQVLEDVNAVKLTDRLQALREGIQKGQPRCLGVSQVMLGLMIMSYSIPLHFTEFTQLVTLGVPWWSGTLFITAGAVAIILEKQCTVKILRVCLLISVVSVILSVVAMIIYIIDISKNPVVPCGKVYPNSCSQQHYTTRMSIGLKSYLFLFTLTHTVISCVLCFSLYRQRQSFQQYNSLLQDAPSTPSELTPPDIN
ncbi:transmembrane protein 176 [Thalassophryne amazonica]|uniref:transmembrane protein 176 n=1 Tax=Thalassophryne amazonica TaxID=390379 RepID=UPI0014720FBB|nr:transmembrane protein 176 [Thalassophryne amazonica]